MTSDTSRLRLVPLVLHQLRRIYWRTFRPVTLGVAGIVLDDQQRVLLIRNSYRAGWHLPGGAVERNERFIDALARELFEEVGVQPIQGTPELLGVYANFSEGNFDHVAVFIVKSWERLRAEAKNFEVLEQAFYSTVELPDDVGSGTRRRIEELVRGQSKMADW